METQNKQLGGYAVEIDPVRNNDCVWWRYTKANVDGLFVQRSDVKSVKCGESVPQLGLRDSEIDTQTQTNQGCESD